MEKLNITQRAIDLISNNGVTEVYVNPRTPVKCVLITCMYAPVKLEVGHVYRIYNTNKTYIIVISKLPDDKYEVIGDQGIYTFDAATVDDVSEMVTDSAVICCNNHTVENDTHCYFNGERISSCREMEEEIRAALIIS